MYNVRSYIVTKYPDDPLPEGNPREFNEQAPSEISYPNPTESESLESLMQEAERGSFDHDESSEAATGEDLSGNDAEIDPPSETDSTTPRGEPTEPEKPQKRSWPDYVRWGFSAKNGSVRFIKLLLDESKASKDVNKETRKQLFLLKRTLLDDNGTGTIIERELDVIVDFLSSLMLHAQEQLQADGYLRADDTVEIVFAVPVAWTQKACRIMESAILEAMTRAGLPTDSIINGDGLLIVSEPEAGATYMLTNEPKIMPHNTFVLVDAGGGTTDATTFGVSQTYPLSLVRETVSPSGQTLFVSCCGRLLLTTMKVYESVPPT